MIPYGRRFPRLSRVENRDATKTTVYVRLDLILKGISAIGLLLLGIAGWILQAKTEEARRRAETVRQQLEESDRRSRAFLPAFRALVELELTLDDATQALSHHTISDPALTAVATRIRAAAASAYIGRSDMVVPAHLPDCSNVFGRRVNARIGVRAGAFLLGDLLHGLRLYHSERMGYKNPVMTVAKDNFGLGASLTVQAASNSDDSLSFEARGESAEAWQLWLGDRPISVSEIEDNLTLIADALHEQVIDATAQLVAIHPDLGDKVVAIRNEVLSLHREHTSK